MKKEQKVIITSFDTDVNRFLDEGWTVVSVTSSHANTSFVKFCFVIERDKK
jgi:hypothetical protein